MISARLAVLLLAGAGPALAQAPTRGTYVARLGTDTVAVERFALTDSSLTGVVLNRLGMTTRTDYQFRLRPNGSAEWAEWIERPVHGSVDTVTARFESDSSRVVRRSGAVVTYHAGRPLPPGLCRPASPGFDSTQRAGEFLFRYFGIVGRLRTEPVAIRQTEEPTEPEMRWFQCWRTV